MLWLLRNSRPKNYYKKVSFCNHNHDTSLISLCDYISLTSINSPGTQLSYDVSWDNKCQMLSVRPKKKDSCVQVSEVKKIRVGRSKNIFILDFFFITNVLRF